MADPKRWTEAAEKLRQEREVKAAEEAARAQEEATRAKAVAKSKLAADKARQDEIDRVVRELGNFLNSADGKAAVRMLKEGNRFVHFHGNNGDEFHALCGNGLRRMNNIGRDVGIASTRGVVELVIGHNGQASEILPRLKADLDAIADKILTEPKTKKPLKKRRATKIGEI